MIAGLKPYPEYKDSGVEWLGDVPEHWEVLRLKTAFQNIVGGSTPSSSETEYWDGDIVWITPVDVSKTKRLNDSLRCITQKGLKSCSSELVPQGSLIITSRAPVGNVAIAERELCTNQGCKALIPDFNKINTTFAFYLLGITKSEFQSLATGTTFTEISTTKLGAVPLALPPLPEQTAIVRFLDYADNRIRRSIHAKQKLITLLEEEKQAIIHNAVTRGLDPDVHLKPSGVEWLGDVPEHWEVKPAKFFFREVDERSTTGTEELLSVSHITGVTPRSQKNITMFMAESNVGHKLCRSGDLVINTMWAWMAALGVSKQVGLVSPSYGVYRPLKNSQLLSDYVDLLLRSAPYRAEYLCRSTGIRSSRLRLYPDQFLRIKLICPPVDEQNAILQSLKKGTFENENIIATMKQEITLLREYRTRLIADVVTGKLDVREVAARLPDEDSDEGLLIDDVEIPENEMADIDECDWNEEVRE